MDNEKKKNNRENVPTNISRYFVRALCKYVGVSGWTVIVCVDRQSSCDDKECIITCLQLMLRLADLSFAGRAHHE